MPEGGGLGVFGIAFPCFLHESLEHGQVEVDDRQSGFHESLVGMSRFDFDHGFHRGDFYAEFLCDFGIVGFRQPEIFVVGDGIDGCRVGRRTSGAVGGRSGALRNEQKRRSEQQTADCRFAHGNPD